MFLIDFGELIRCEKWNKMAGDSQSAYAVVHAPLGNGAPWYSQADYEFEVPQAGINGAGKGRSRGWKGWRCR